MWIYLLTFCLVTAGAVMVLVLSMMLLFFFFFFPLWHFIRAIYTKHEAYHAIKSCIWRVAHGPPIYQLHETMFATITVLFAIVTINFVWLRRFIYSFLLSLYLFFFFILFLSQSVFIWVTGSFNCVNERVFFRSEEIFDQTAISIGLRLMDMCVCMSVIYIAFALSSTINRHSIDWNEIQPNISIHNKMKANNIRTQ